MSEFIFHMLSARQLFATFIVHDKQVHRHVKKGSTMPLSRNKTKGGNSRRSAVIHINASACACFTYFSWGLIDDIRRCLFGELFYSCDAQICLFSNWISYITYFDGECVCVCVEWQQNAASMKMWKSVWSSRKSADFLSEVLVFVSS